MPPDGVQIGPPSPSALWSGSWAAVINLSPFTHLSAVPAEVLAIVPIALLLAATSRPVRIPARARTPAQDVPLWLERR